MPARLTILLPLKGRAPFTLRFLWYANARKLPYRFLLADGQVNPALAKVLGNSKTIFPNLDVEYVQYPDDANLARYFAKMHDAINRVSTPYVMLADNDDFLVSSGINRSMDFLDRAPEYASCGGGIAGFSVYPAANALNPGLTGPFNKFTFRYAAEDRSQDIGFNQVAARLVAGAQYSWGFYAVYRVGILEQVWRDVVKMNFSDLMLHEWFCGLRTLTMGKARSDASVISYLRQYWTSMRSSFRYDWVHHLVGSNFSSDFSKMIDRLATAAAEVDGADAAEIAERLRQTFDAWYGGFLRHNYGPSGMLRQFLRTNYPELLLWLKTRRRFSVPLERRMLLRQLSGHGATAAYLDEFREELAGTEDVLTGKAFAAFFRSLTPTLGLNPQ